MLAYLGKIARDTKGNVLALAAAGTVSLVGSAGLAVDAVQWYLWKRQLQQAVDAGSLAGAYALSQAGDVRASAATDIEANANTSATIQSISTPPGSGAYAGDTTAVEVIATTSRKLPFSSLFLASPPVIQARSVAAFVSMGEHCIISLAEDGVGINVSGSAVIDLGCGSAANSAGSQAIYLEGSSWFDSEPLSTVGGIDMSSSNVPSGTDLHPYGLPQQDPLAARNLQIPSSPSGCTATAFTAPPNRSTTVTPGRYCSGMALKGDVHMDPGVYIIDRGAFEVSSQANIFGEGVTIILTGSGSGNIATAQIAGGASVDLRAPTEAEDPVWKNILLYQDPRAAQPLSDIAGGSTFQMEGVVYMPSGNVRFAGNSGQHSDCLLMVVHRVTLTGTTSLDNNCTADYDDLDLSGHRIRVVE